MIPMLKADPASGKCSNLPSLDVFAYARTQIRGIEKMDLELGVLHKQVWRNEDGKPHHCDDCIAAEGEPEPFVAASSPYQMV